MKIVAIADYLGEKANLDPFRRVVKEELPDLLLFTGGVTNGEEHIKELELSKKEARDPEKTKDELFKERIKKKEDFEVFFDFLKSLDIPCMIVPGKTDSPLGLFQTTLSDRLEHANMHYLHLKFVQMEGVLFSGCGGLLAEDSEDFFELRLDKDSVLNNMKNLRSFKQEKILLFHTPPTLEPGDPTVPGSVYVDELIDALSPKMLFYGLAKKNGMKIIDDCVTINPGSLMEGEYVMVNTTTMKVDFKRLG